MKVRWRELVIAFLMAVVLWYGVSGSEKMESRVEVRVDYRGLPQGLIVRSGLVNKVSVRVRASVGMLRTLSGRDFAFSMDLSDVRKGENVLAINLSYLPFRTGVEVIDATPSRITLDVDTVESKMVPLVAAVTGDLPKDYMAQVTFTPPEVTVTGASALLHNLQFIEVPVQVADPAIPGTTESKRLLPLPDGVDAEPNEVKLTTLVGLKRKLVRVTRTVQVDAPAAFGKYVRPDKVTISASVPESFAGKAGSSTDIKAFVHLEQRELGIYTLPVLVSLPEGAELVGVEPARVSVTLEQKQPTAPPKKK